MLRKIHQRLLQKRLFADETKKTSRVNSDSYKSNYNAKKVHVMKQAEVKRKIMECVKVGEKVILRIQTKNKVEEVVKRGILNYLSVVEKVTLKF